MGNFFTNFFNSSNFSLSAGPSDNAVGVDIGSSSIKVVEIKRKHGKAMLETYGVLALGQYAGVDVGSVTNLPIDKLSEALKEVFKQSSITSKHCAFSIQMQSALIFTMELPIYINNEDLPAIIPNEARKYIPVPISEVSLDYFILPSKQASFQEINDKNLSTQKEEKKEILVVALQNEALNKYNELVKTSNLSADFFEVEVFSSIRANFEHELAFVLLVDLGASRTRVALVEFGMIRNYHTIDRGGMDITNSISRSLEITFSEAEELKKQFGLFNNPKEKQLNSIVQTHLDYIFSEISNILFTYEKKYNRTVNKIIFSGGGALLNGLMESATSHFNVEIQIGRAFSKVTAPVFLEKVLKKISPEFAVAIGLALRKLEG